MLRVEVGQTGIYLRVLTVAVVGAFVIIVSDHTFWAINFLASRFKLVIAWIYFSGARLNRMSDQYYE
ncbi:hypothetical protein HG15A2_19850 [Adhaeretor mobilis]|uniref:Uncharacterized protein n=1 Tax=Adhaeretor mobilis TaxID=1930276 RepID=A0A517MUZ5_9BACT|nr:hypothetical protein HG15A2_19850 [Adhaeretor mobilis]